jgi:hypothetical protein
MQHHFGILEARVSTHVGRAKDAPLSRTEQIATRIEQELQRCSATHKPQSISHRHQQDIILEALWAVRRYSNSLDSGATLGFVTRMILAVTMHTLGRLYYPLGALPETEQLANDIHALVHAPNQPSR